MFNTTQNEQYVQLIESIKVLNNEKKKIVSSKEYKIGQSYVEKKKRIKDNGICEISNMIRSYIQFKKGEKYSMSLPLKNMRDYGKSNYFSKERIVVYTCITGGYDEVIEPLFVPDNCDFYAVTDFELPQHSKWKRIDINNVSTEETEGEVVHNSAVMMNRLIKMKPHILFPEYRYSVYVDGNIRICTDMTEYVNRLSNVGIGTFSHSQRTCIYEEAAACVAMKKDTRENIQKHIQHLKSSGMPSNYGMAQCSVIVREHNTTLCIQIMEEWWKMFCMFAKRDQLSLPFVLYSHCIPIEMVTTLGANIYRDDSFEIVKHNQ